MKKFAFFLLIIIFLSSCTGKTSDNMLTISGYYTYEDNAFALTSDTVALKQEGVDAIPELFAKLKAPSSKKLSSPIPRGIELLDHSIIEDTCFLTLSPYYAKLSPTQLVTVNAALTYSMSQLPGIDFVSIKCDNKISVFEQSDFLTTLPLTRYDSYTVNLYFTTKNHTGITKETKSISISDNTNLEKEVIFLLSENPAPAEVESPFPKGTRVNSVSVDEGTCIVDVSEEFITNTPHNPEQEKAILFSIVNTLTELPKIDRVKFLINGEPGFGFAYYDISEPFTNFGNLFGIS